MKPSFTGDYPSFLPQCAGIYRNRQVLTVFTFDSSITESWSFSISKFAVGDFFLKTLFSFYKTLLECESTLVELCPYLQPLCPYLQPPCQWIYSWRTPRCWLSDQRLLISPLPSYIKKKKITQEETNNQDRLNVEYDSVSRGKNTIPHNATQFLNNSLK